MPIFSSATKAPTHLLLLKAGGVLRIDEPVGQSIAVFDGTVWLTQVDDDGRDVFLHGGDTFDFDRDGPVVVEGIDNAQLIVWPALAKAA